MGDRPRHFFFFRLRMDKSEHRLWQQYQRELEVGGYDELASRVEQVVREAVPASTDQEKTNRIRKLNDVLRVAGIGGEVVCTRALANLSESIRHEVFLKIRQFEDFNERNDPYKEHDCASLDHEGEQYMFKVDYYDQEKLHGSEAPENPNVTSRVMTVLMASEY